MTSAQSLIQKLQANPNCPKTIEDICMTCFGKDAPASLAKEFDALLAPIAPSLYPKGFKENFSHVFALSQFPSFWVSSSMKVNPMFTPTMPVPERVLDIEKWFTPVEYSDSAEYRMHAAVTSLFDQYKMLDRPESFELEEAIGDILIDETKPIRVSELIKTIAIEFGESRLIEFRDGEVYLLDDVRAAFDKKLE